MDIPNYPLYTFHAILSSIYNLLNRKELVISYK